MVCIIKRNSARKCGALYTSAVTLHGTMTAPETFEEEYIGNGGCDLQSSWKDKGLSTEIKIQLLQTCVFEVLLHAAETWTTKNNDQRRLLAFEMRCYRGILEVNWQDHISNNEVKSDDKCSGSGQRWTPSDRESFSCSAICRMPDDRLL